MAEQQIENYVTIKEVQEYLGVRRETVLQWISKRNMPAYKAGGLWKFKISEPSLVPRLGEMPKMGAPRWGEYPFSAGKLCNSPFLG